jgi:hypothetical protein
VRANQAINLNAFGSAARLFRRARFYIFILRSVCEKESTPRSAIKDESIVVK